VTPDTALDLHVIKYTYPGSSAADYVETHAGVTESNMLTKGDSATVGADYSGDVAGDGTTWNYSAAYSYPLPMDVTLAGTVGYYDFKKRTAVASTGVQKRLTPTGTSASVKKWLVLPGT
jgi:hypothetical protein